MKLGLKVRQDGTLAVIEVKSGEEIEGVMSVEAESGFQCVTRIRLECNAYDKEGVESIG